MQRRYIRVKQINNYFILKEHLVGEWRKLHNEEVGGRTISKWLLKRYDGMVWIGLTGLRIGTSGGLL
jgi:hypothetical protein